MPSVDSPAELPTPLSSSGHRPSAPAPQLKLRDSCHACASSKVKCHKEKPTCSRCAKRGLTCEYVAARRAGRRHDTSHSRTTHEAAMTARAAIRIAHPSPETNLSATLSEPSKNPYPPSSFVHSPTSRSALSAPAPSSMLFPSPAHMAEQTLAFGLLNPLADLDAFFATPLSLSGQDNPSDILSQVDVFSAAGNGSDGSATFVDALPSFDDVFCDLGTHSTTPSSPSRQNGRDAGEDSAGHAKQRCSGLREQDSSRCLPRALALIHEIYPGPLTTCSTSGTDRAPGTTPPPTIQMVMAETEKAMEAVSSILKCMCSDDFYLLSIISLVTFKILDWYAAAAVVQEDLGDSDGDSMRSSQSDVASRQSRRSSQVERVVRTSTAVGNYCLEGEDSVRMAAQLVLSRLHRVQHVISQLESKMERQAGGNHDVDNDDDEEDHELRVPSALVSPFPPLILGQMGMELRKRLKALSLEIVEGLRRQ